MTRPYSISAYRRSTGGGVKDVAEVRPKLLVLILPRVTDVSEKVEGFKAGADDYLVKPFRRKKS